MKCTVAIEESLLGGLVGLPSTISVEGFARAGYDFVVLDLQHGTFGYEFAQIAVQLLDVLGVESLNDIAVAEDAEDPGNQSLALAVALGELLLQGQHDRVRGGQSHRLRITFQRSEWSGRGNDLAHRWRSVLRSRTLTTRGHARRTDRHGLVGDDRARAELG